MVHLTLTDLVSQVERKLTSFSKELLIVKIKINSPTTHPLFFVPLLPWSGRFRNVQHRLAKADVLTKFSDRTRVQSRNQEDGFKESFKTLMVEIGRLR